MIIFGPATITWRSRNLLSNGDFELWSAGSSSAPDDWTASGTGSTVAREGTIVYEGDYAAKRVTDTSNPAYLYQAALHATKGLSYWLEKTVTFDVYGYCNKASVLRAYIYDGIGYGYSSAYHTGDSSWQKISGSRVINAGADRVGFYCYLGASTGPNTGYFDLADVYEGPYDLGKTFGGIELNLESRQYRKLYSLEQVDEVYGGTGVIHLFEYNTELVLSSDLTLNEYGEVVFETDRMKVMLYDCKLFLAPSMSLGTNDQHAFNVSLHFKRHPDSGKVIKIEE